MCALLGQMGNAAERLSQLGKRVSRHKPRNTNVGQKTRHVPECDRKASSVCKTERVKDCNIKSLKK